MYVFMYVCMCVGWGFFGNENYAKQRATGLLDSLDNGGRDTLSPLEYGLALAKRFPL